MDIYGADSKGDAIADVLRHIDGIADWLRQEARSFDKPEEPPKRGIAVKRYRISPNAGFHSRPTYLLRRR